MAYEKSKGKIRFITADNILVMNREAEISLYHNDIPFINYSLRKDADNKGVRIISWRWMGNSEIEALVEWK